MTTNSYFWWPFVLLVLAKRPIIQSWTLAETRELWLYKYEKVRSQYRVFNNKYSGDCGQSRGLLKSRSLCFVIRHCVMKCFILMYSNYFVCFVFSRLFLGVGQNDGSADLQHQQHDRTGALHTAGSPLAAPGCKAYSLLRTNSLHAAYTYTHLSLMCSYTHALSQTDKHRGMHCNTHSYSPPVVLRIHTLDELLGFPTLCPFPTPACQKRWAIWSTVESATTGKHQNCNRGTIRTNRHASQLAKWICFKVGFDL